MSDRRDTRNPGTRKTRSARAPKKAPEARHRLGPRELSKQRTRQSLIDAALDCFSEKGIDAPSLSEICERAGCTRGAFYVHFKDRDELVAAAMDRRRGTVLAEFLESRVSLGDVLEFFAHAADSGSFPLPGAVRSAELMLACRRSPTIRRTQIRLLKRIVDRVERLVRADKTQHRLRSDLDPGGLALLILLLESGFELLFDMGYPIDVRRALRALATAIEPRSRTID